MPVRELTVFKDGHTYVLRDTVLEKNADGTVVLDELSRPVLGTFWPFVSGGDARLVSARSGTDEVTVQRPASSVLELALANVGRFVTLELKDGADVSGKLQAVPHHEGGGNILLIEGSAGVRAVAMERVRGISITGECALSLEQKVQKARIVLDIDGGGEGARVGVVYVEKGFHWIPSYRIDLDGEGKAKVQLQATLVNELVDLDGATVNLVVGVPKFAFGDMVDPIALQHRTSQIAHAARQQQRFSNFLGNSLTTQVASYGVPERAERTPQQVPEVGKGEVAEDLFVFPVTDVKLKKGECLMVPVTSFELPYENAYRLEIPMAPPMEYQRQLSDQRIIQLARELAAPKVMHLLRLDNTGPGPLTTAPALVFSKGRILAQGHMKYTPRGAKADLEINTAIDICIETAERETGRETKIRMGDAHYAKIDLAGTIELHNAKAEAVEVEVTRCVLGQLDEVSGDGERTQLDLVRAWANTPRPEWWTWWSWPWWWYHYNGFGEGRWTVKLEPNERVELTAKWHYYWR